MRSNSSAFREKCDESEFEARDRMRENRVRVNLRGTRMKTNVVNENEVQAKSSSKSEGNTL